MVETRSRYTASLIDERSGKLQARAWTHDGRPPARPLNDSLGRTTSTKKSLLTHLHSLVLSNSTVGQDSALESTQSRECERLLDILHDLTQLFENAGHCRVQQASQSTGNTFRFGGSEWEAKATSKHLSNLASACKSRDNKARGLLKQFSDIVKGMRKEDVGNERQACMLPRATWRRIREGLLPITRNVLRSSYIDAVEHADLLMPLLDLLGACASHDEGPNSLALLLFDPFDAPLKEHDLGPSLSRNNVIALLAEDLRKAATQYDLTVAGQTFCQIYDFGKFSELCQLFPDFPEGFLFQRYVDAKEDLDRAAASIIDKPPLKQDGDSAADAWRRLGALPSDSAPGAANDRGVHHGFDDARAKSLLRALEDFHSTLTNLKARTQTLDYEVLLSEGVSFLEGSVDSGRQEIDSVCARSSSIQSVGLDYASRLGPLRFSSSHLHDHSFKRCDPLLLPPPALRRLQAEIASLPSSLPVHENSSIFLVQDESNMGLLRFAITGPGGTPYENGVFVFDMEIPQVYPAAPPRIKFLTTGRGTIRFNPNLYTDGKVCLSLLGTWKGPQWDPRFSNLLQVLLSIQSLIFVPDPYFNEPGFEAMQQTAQEKSEQYNRQLLPATIRWAILEYINAPPVGFESVCRAYFHIKAEAISAQLKTWMTSLEIPAPAAKIRRINSPSARVNKCKKEANIDAVSVAFTMDRLAEEARAALGAVRSAGHADQRPQHTASAMSMAVAFGA